MKKNKKTNSKKVQNNNISNKISDETKEKCIKIIKIVAPYTTIAAVMYLIGYLIGFVL